MATTDEPPPPTARELDAAVDLTSIAKFGTVVPRIDEQIASDELLGEVIDKISTTYEAPLQYFRYDPDPEPDIWDQVFGDGPSLIWVYAGRECIGSLQVVDGEQRFFPLTQVWEGDQA